MTESSRPELDALPLAGEDAALDGVDSARTKLVALCLARERSATLAELQAVLDEPRLSLLRILGVLTDHGLVERVEGTYHFRGEPDEAPTGEQAPAAVDDAPSAEDVAGVDEPGTEPSASEGQVAATRPVEDE